LGCSSFIFASYILLYLLSHLLLFFSILPPPPRSTLFPYTTLFRSMVGYYSNIAAVFNYVAVDYVALIHACDDTGSISTHRVSLEDRKSTRLNSSHVSISYAVFCLKKKNKKQHSFQTNH